jgi:hypothetical protein
MPRVKLRPYAVILDTSPGRIVVRIWARDREHALSEAPEIYGGEAIAAQHCPQPLP